MQPLNAADLTNLHDYELERPDFRRRVIELKARRRVALGPMMTLVFEDRDTIRFQVQEMLRAERIVQPEKIQHELDVYNELLPGPGQVAATLFIEITEPARVQQVLDGFIGLDEPGGLVLNVGARAYPALFAPGQSREDRISAVHYIRFPLGSEGREALVAGGEAALEVAHGGYEARQQLGPDTVQELIRDLG